jgi:hypothetical protein
VVFKETINLVDAAFIALSRCATQRTKTTASLRAGRVIDVLRTLDRLDEGQHWRRLLSMLLDLLDIGYKMIGELSSIGRMVIRAVAKKARMRARYS